MRKIPTLRPSQLESHYNEGDFIERDFLDEEFPDDLFYGLIANQYKGSVIISVLEKEVVDPKDSRIVVHDYDNQISISGGRDIKENIYEIIPDYEPVQIMFDNMDRYLAGYQGEFKYVPVANPTIPPNKYYQLDNKELELEWIKKQGCKITTTTEAQRIKLEDQEEFLTQTIQPGDLILDRYNLATATELKKYLDCSYVSMQFNPYNPLSLGYVKSYVRKGKVISGEYEYRGVYYKFYMDLKDERYRLHSDQWLQHFSFSDNGNLYFAMFDMVSASPFADRLGPKRTEVMIREPVLNTPIYSDRIPAANYSIIGPWKGKIGFGTKKKIYCPYLTFPYMLNKEMPTFKRVKAKVKKNTIEFQVNKQNRVMKLNLGIIEDETQKFYYKDDGGTHRVYYEDELGDFNYMIADIGFNDGPRLRYGKNFDQVKTLIPSFRCISLELLYTQVAKMTLYDKNITLPEWLRVYDFNSNSSLFPNEHPTYESTGDLLIIGNDRPQYEDELVDGRQFVVGRKEQDETEGTIRQKLLDKDRKGSRYRNAHNKILNKVHNAIDLEKIEDNRRQTSAKFKDKKI
jgi:hypothetical protein